MTKEFDGYFFCDTETGGLKEHHPILEIACIRTDLEFRIKEYWRTYVKPYDGSVIEKEALDTHHLSEDFLKDQPSEMDVALSLQCFLKGRGRLRFAGYNCKYDLGMLEGLKKRTIGESELWGFETPWLCLLEEAREKLPNLPPVWNERWKKNQTHTLELVCRHFGITIQGAHQAAADIYATVEIARKLLK